MADYTTTPVFAMLNVGIEYTILHRTPRGEERLDGTLVQVRVAALAGEGEGVPMVGFRPRVGPALVEVPWESITSVAQYRRAQ